MVYKIKNLSIVDEHAIDILSQNIDLLTLNAKSEYDLLIEYFNDDLNENMYDKDASYEIKRHHLLFIRQVRNYFQKNNIKVNEVNLIGTVSKIMPGEMTFAIYKSKYQDFKKNEIVPCKEVLLYEDGKKTLNFMLMTKQITEEEYEMNISMLQEEFCIMEFEDDFGYIN